MHYGSFLSDAFDAVFFEVVVAVLVVSEGERQRLMTFVCRSLMTLGPL